MRVSRAEKSRSFTRKLRIEIPNSTRNRQPNASVSKQIIRKLTLADELMQIIPMKYKKKLRELIDAYEN